MDKLYARLTTILRNVFDDNTIVVTPGLTAAQAPEWYSLSHIRWVLAVQKAFQTKFSAAQIADWKNAGELAALVRAKTPAS